MSARAASFWDRMAERYARSRIPDMPAYLHTLERTRSYLKPTDEVLELGCGTGSTAIELAANVRSILASDVSPKMIAIAERKRAETSTGNIRFVVATPESGAFGPERFDVVMAFNLLHLVEDLPATLADLSRKVKPGGLFISKTVCLSEPAVPFWVKLMMPVLPVMQAVGLAPAVRAFTIAELEAAVRQAGFDIVEAGNFPASPPRRYLVARRR